MRILFTFFTMLLGVSIYAQSTNVSGTVTDTDTGEPLIGATVVEKGTDNGTITDVDGNFQLTVSGPDVTITFSYVGYGSVDEPLNNRSLLNMAMSLDFSELNEVVVIGYGTASADELTTAVKKVGGDEIVKTPNSNPMQSLQGKVAGVQITSSGAPGASPNVRVRGLSSFPGNDDSQPLYVVDGMFVDNIDFLNSGDIKDVTILKDASASAIYGVRAANGVIIIETKSGDFDSPVEIVYDGYYGVQRPQNVLKMANSEQFVNYVNAVGNASEISLVENTIARYGRSRVNPNLPTTNTDWFKEVMSAAAPVQSHTLSISGGNSKTKYAVGTSYFKQDGLIEHMRNDYQRMNFRARIDAKATDWLTVGGNVNISNAKQYNAEGGVWFQTYFAIPTLPVYDELNTSADPTGYGNAQLLGYRGAQNPFFLMENKDNRNNVGKILGNFYADLSLIPKKLSFKTSVNYFYQNVISRNVSFDYNNGVTSYQNYLTRIANNDFNTIWDNVLTYDEVFGNHGLTVTAGYSYRSELNEKSQVRGEQIQTINRNDESSWYIPKGSELNTEETYDDGARLFGVSYFGRISYDYKSKYLVSGSYRRDGTNKFSEKWGNFFTLSGGWVLTEEDFFDISGIDFLKIRGGWGQMGNDGIAPAIGQTTFSQISIAIDDQLVTGVRPDNVYDLINSWETTTETNLGISGQFLNRRLTLEADIYRRDTKDAVLNVFLSGTGESPRRNAGEIRNEGLEIALGWSDKLNNGITYNVGANLGLLHNEVLSVGDQEFLNGGSAEFRQISLAGSSLNEFYGYEILGVFQNAEEVTNSGYTADFITTNNLQPGDFHFRDVNEDGVINSEDRVLLGSFIPSYNYGFNFGLGYKGISLTANFQGQGGNKILNRKRGEIIFTQDTNIDADLANNLWDGEGTTNSYPSAAGYRKSYNNNQMSEFWLEDGDYFRIQNVRLAYSFKNYSVLGAKVPETTVSFTADRPLTVFNYNGFNPEVADGIDRQTYPIPAVYTIGLNIKL